LRETHNGVEPEEAVRWIGASDPQRLGDLGLDPNGETRQSVATAVSADGSVIVGYSTSPSGYQAFRWASGMVGLGDVPGGTFGSAANAVSADGSVVVGQCGDENQPAMIWDQVHGMRRLYDVLVNDLGLTSELQGWTLQSATGISADGQTVVG